MSAVVDDDDSGVFTAGAIVTVTVRLTRKNSGEVFPILQSEPPKDTQTKKVPEGQDAKKEKEDSIAKLLVDKKKTKWTKEQKQVKKGGNKPGKRKNNKSNKSNNKEEANKQTDQKEDKTKKDSATKRVEELGEEDTEDSQSHSDESEAGDADNESPKEEKSEVDEDAEWERFQKGMVKKEKVLEGQSKLSHSVHCPLFTDDKQEYW